MRCLVSHWRCWLFEWSSRLGPQMRTVVDQSDVIQVHVFMCTALTRATYAVPVKC